MNGINYFKITGISIIFNCLAILCLFDLCSGEFPNYDEIKSLGGDCPRKDSCSSPRDLSTDDLFFNLCECNPSCKTYGTCCLDSPHNPALTNETVTNSGISYQADCHSMFGTSLAVFAKTECKQSWQGDVEVKSLCENDIKDFKDPITVMPVANTITERIYKNFFCALCNDDVDHLVFWNIHIEKPNIKSNFTYDEDTLMQELTYNDSSNKWGVVTGKWANTTSVYPSNETIERRAEGNFEAVSISFEEPDDLEGKLHICVPGLITDCHYDWKDEEVRNKCHSYMSMIYRRHNNSQHIQRYRNIHCAVCNFADGRSFCYESTPYDFDVSKPQLSFNLLLDVNLSDGNQVGKTSRCKSGELYDVFFKKCRAMLCMKPDSRLENKTCVSS